MIVGRGHGPVGTWWFEGDEDAEPHGRANLAELLRRVELVAQVFEASELLLPRRLALSGWLAGSYAAGTLHRADGEPVVLDLNGTASGLAQRALDATGELYPGSVEVSGTGIVLDADGARAEQDDVVWLEALTTSHHVVTVHVQSDAFLRWTVTGAEQEQVWRRNAPRLEGALEMTEQMLGIDAYADKTDHALVDGYRLLNRTDVEGDIVPTLEE